MRLKYQRFQLWVILLHSQLQVNIKMTCFWGNMVHMVSFRWRPSSKRETTKTSENSIRSERFTKNWFWYWPWASYDDNSKEGRCWWRSYKGLGLGSTIFPAQRWICHREITLILGIFPFYWPWTRLILPGNAIDNLFVLCFILMSHDASRSIMILL